VGRKGQDDGAALTPEDRKLLNEILASERLTVRLKLSKVVDALSAIVLTQASLANVVLAPQIGDERYKHIEEYFRVQANQFRELQSLVDAVHSDD
jgi:hypothetical protein